MGRAGDPSIKAFDGEEYTCITFRPDLPKFKMSILDKDIVALLTRRAYDIAGSTKGVRVFFNGKRLPVSCNNFCFFLFVFLVYQQLFLFINPLFYFIKAQISLNCW